MISSLKLLTAALLLASTSTAENANDCSAAEGTCTNPDAFVDCGVYMAPSTVGDYSNLGIYTAKAMKNGEKVPYPEIIVPLLWRTFESHPKKSYTDGELWDRYIWEQYVGGLEALEDLDRSHEKAACFIPGVGCTVNSMLDLANIESAQGSEFDEVVDRSSPGAGAFTPYHSSPTIIQSPKGFEDGVEAGQELFATYGDQWIPSIPDVAVTFGTNFQVADQLMGDFEDWIVEHEENPATKKDVSEELLKDMWDIMTDFPHHGPTHFQQLSVLPKEWSRDRLKELKHIKKVQKEMKALPEGQESSSPPLPKPPSISSKYWADRGKVSLDFLQKEGKCQDHIRPDISTVPHAGRGAFASRDLPKGTIVGYAPLVHIGEKGEKITTVVYNGESKHGMDRFEHRFVKKDEEPNLKEYRKAAKKHKNRYTKPDLVINYTFGHKDSTLLLTPYGAMVNYINHKSAKDGDGPNVRIQWPDRELIAHKPEWLGKPLSFFRDTIDKIGLSFDYVALRDIKEGEEVFIDYGDEWDEAWKEHVANWEPPAHAEGYVHSSKFNAEYLRTVDELEEDPYPWNLHTLCTDSYAVRDEVSVYVESYFDTDSAKSLPCRVLGREKDGGNYTYTVELQFGDDDTEIVDGYIRGESGVQLYDIAYSSMWHMKEAFRHKLAVPDDMFPENWKINKE